MESYFLVYLILLPTLVVTSLYAPLLKTRSRYLMPTILNNNKHSKEKYRQTGVSYILWSAWLISLNVCLAYWLQGYNKPSEISPTGNFLLAFHFISLFLAIIFVVISLYYFYEALFMRHEEASSKLESITHFDLKLIHTYALKLKVYLIVNLSAIASISLPIPPIEFINIIAIIVFLLSLGRMRAYELKLSGCLGENPDKLFLSPSSNLSKNIYIHSFQLLKKYKISNKESN